MQIIGNFFLLLSLLIIGCLFYLTFISKSSGGDAKIGSAYMAFYLAIAFGVCIVLLAAIIGFGGGFAWLSLGRFGSGGMLLLCFLILLLGTVGLMSGKFHNVSILTFGIAVTTLIVLLVTFAVLLNENLQMVVTSTIIKWGLASILAINSLVIVTIILGALGSRVGSVLNVFRNDFKERSILKEIHNWDVSNGITGLFIYCGYDQSEQIREKAVLKIKSKPDWQEDLYNELKGDNVVNAFRFLSANSINDKSRFAKGVYLGLLSEARLIRQTLRSTTKRSQVYDGQFQDEIDLSLLIVEKFKDMGVDLKPAVIELRGALDEPIDFDNPNPSVKGLLDIWINRL